MFTVKAGFNATEHAGAADSTLYNTANGWGAATKLVVGNRGVNIAKVNYYTPKTAAWNNIGSHTGIADVASYANGKVVLSGSDFFEAQIDFSSTNTVANSVKYSTGDLVKNTGGTNYYEAGTNWAAVQSKSTAADPFGTTSSQYVQIGGASGDFLNPSRILITQIFPLTTILHTIKGPALSRLRMDQVIITSGLPIQK